MNGGFVRTTNPSAAGGGGSGARGSRPGMYEIFTGPERDGASRSIRFVRHRAAFAFRFALRENLLIRSREPYGFPPFGAIFAQCSRGVTPGGLAENWVS
jgi:hypothetical protein